MPASTAADANVLLAINNLITQLGRKHQEFCARRTDVRYGYAQPVQLKAGQAGRTQVVMQAWCTDVSYTGAGLITRQPLLEGRHFLLEFAPDTPAAFTAPVRVLRCDQPMEWMCHVGVKFLVD